jgi:hypothetical protein
MYAALFNKQVVYSYQGDMLKVLHAGLSALNTVETLRPSEVANPAMAYGALTLATGLMGLHSFADYYRRLTNSVLPQAGVHQTALSRALLGMYASQRADWTEALETITNVVNRFNEIGAFHSADETVSYLGRVYAYMGDLDRALELLYGSYERAKQRNDRIIRLQLFVMVVLLLIRKNNLSPDSFEDLSLLVNAESAEVLFREAFEANPMNRGFYHAIRALYFMHIDSDIAAFSSLQESARIVLEHGIERSMLYFELYAALAQLSAYFLNFGALANDDLAAAQAIFRNAVKKLGKYGKVFTLAKPSVYLYQGWEQQHAKKLPQARDLWVKSLASATELHMPYDEGLAHAALARSPQLSHEERVSHASEARRRFERLGAAFDLAVLTPRERQ